MYAPSVGVTPVIAPALRAKTNYASTEDGSHTSENRYKGDISLQGAPQQACVVAIYQRGDVQSGESTFGS